jgi:hypothetical protein
LVPEDQRKAVEGPEKAMAWLSWRALDKEMIGLFFNPAPFLSKAARDFYKP